MSDGSPFCAAPFVQMTLQPAGKVSPCCYHYAHVLGDINRQDFDAIWNGDRMRKLRREFLTGNIKTCRTKMRYLKCHEHFAAWLPTMERLEIQPSGPKRLDVRLNGQCNLQCVMCEVWKEPNGVWDGTEFWQRGSEEIFPHLLEIDVLGGEPFIQKDTYRLIDAVTATNPRCTWGFVTNAHYSFSRRLRSYLDRIQLRYVQISLDSLIPEVYEAIRHKASWATRESGVRGWLDYRKERPFPLRFSFCVMQQNWREVPAFLRFCEDHDAAIDLQFAFYDPSKKSSLELLEVHQKAEILSFWRNAIAERHWSHLASIVAPLEDALTKGGTKALGLN